MKTLNFTRRFRRSHLTGQGCTKAIIVRFAEPLQQAISNLQFLGFSAGAVANVSLLLSLFHHHNLISGHKGVI